MKRLRYENGAIDRLDAQLIAALAANARVSLADLARRVGLSSPTVSERIKRLEESGVIDGYTVVVNYRKLGKPIAAMIGIRPVPGQLKKVAELLVGIPEIVECDRVTGEDCFLARVHVASIDELEGLIDQIAPFAMTTTSIVQTPPVPRRLQPSIAATE